MKDAGTVLAALVCVTLICVVLRQPTPACATDETNKSTRSECVTVGSDAVELKLTKDGRLPYLITDIVLVGDPRLMDQYLELRQGDTTLLCARPAIGSVHFQSPIRVADKPPLQLVYHNGKKCIVTVCGYYETF